MIFTIKLKYAAVIIAQAVYFVNYFLITDGIDDV